MSSGSVLIPNEVFEQTLLGFLEAVGMFLQNDSVSEVMIPRPEEVFIRGKGPFESTNRAPEEGRARVRGPKRPQIVRKTAKKIPES